MIVAKTSVPTKRSLPDTMLPHEIAYNSELPTPSLSSINIERDSKSLRLVPVVGNTSN